MAVRVRVSMVLPSPDISLLSSLFEKSSNFASLADSPSQVFLTFITWVLSTELAKMIFLLGITSPILSKLKLIVFAFSLLLSGRSFAFDSYLPASAYMSFSVTVYLQRFPSSS